MRVIDETKPHWILIGLVDTDGRGLPGESYHVVVPDGTEVDGALDRQGRVRIEGIDAGDCQVSFRDLQRDG